MEKREKNEEERRALKDSPEALIMAAQEQALIRRSIQTGVYPTLPLRESGT